MYDPTDVLDGVIVDVLDNILLVLVVDIFVVLGEIVLLVLVVVFLIIFDALLATSVIIFDVFNSILLLAFFYFIMDVRGWTKWAFFFMVIGLNPIIIYMATVFIDFGHTTNFFFGGFMSLFSAEIQPVLYWIFHTTIDQ